MRKDMKYVVIERPRRGHKDKIWPKGRTRQTPIEDLPHFEAMGKMCGRRYKTKSLSDFLSPLIRFLHSKIGQNWNDAKSEISAVLKKDSTTKIHVWGHIDCYVEENSEVIDEIRVRKHRYGKLGENPLKDNELRDGELYVDEEGVLRKHTVLRKQPENKVDSIVLKNTVLQEVDGIWYKADLVWSQNKYSSEFYELRLPWHYSSKKELLPIVYGESEIVTEKVKTKADFLKELPRRLSLIRQTSTYPFHFTMELAKLENELEQFQGRNEVRSSSTTKFYRIGKNKKQLSEKELRQYGLSNK